jgi:TolB protein
LAAVTGAGMTRPPRPSLPFSLTYEQRYRFDDSSSDLFTYSAASGRAIQLTRNRLYDGRPTWSPGGKELAFVSDRDGANHAIFVMAADGSDLRRLTPANGVGLDPAWSPDGRQLAYSTGGAIAITDRSGSVQAPIVETVGSNVRDPAWSPGGTRIAYVSSGLLFTIAVDGSNQRRIATGVTQDGRPSWSPDGEQIAFASSRTSDADSDIFVVDANGAHLRDLTNHPAFDGAPTWSPDGREIAFVSDRLANYHTEVFVMHPDGSHVVRVTHTGLAWDHDAPAWRPHP